MPTSTPEKKKDKMKGSTGAYLLFVLLASFFTYFNNFSYPAAPFWDEPYHIASAQKYLNGVYFMELHPPLGKLLIAAGEKIVHGNPQNDQFIKTDYATPIPPEFNFTGYRLFPTLLGWLTAPVLFFIFLYFTGNPAIAALFSFLYIFDNAEIVHARGAMVDTPLTFFGMLMTLVFLYLFEKRNPNQKRHILLSALLGLVFGLVMTTKMVGLIFILFIPVLLWRFFPDYKKIVLFLVCGVLGFLVSYLTVWQIHFSVATKIVPELNNNGYYSASDEYKSILASGKTSSLFSFPIMLRDGLKYNIEYSEGVPRLDLCKPDENGSPAFFWPFGARSINYRWEQVGEGVYRYLYLQSNPAGWALGLIGIVLCGFFLLSKVLLPGKEKLKHGTLMLVFFGMYCAYMIAILRLDRVMYLYHYFVPLLLSYILFCLAAENIRQVGSWHVTEKRRIVAMSVIGLAVFGSFQFYRALSYYEPISDDAFKLRAAPFALWELTCVRCQKESKLVVPVQRDQ